MSLAASCYWKPCNRSSMARDVEGQEREKPLPGLWCIFYHACISISITTSWVLKVLVTCNTTYRTGLHINTCELRNFQPTVSTGHVHSTLNETSFEIQLALATNVVSGYIKECIRAGRGLSLSLVAGINLNDITTAISLIIILLYIKKLF